MIMKQIIFNILSQKNLLNKGYDIEELYKAGIDNIILSIGFFLTHLRIQIYYINRS